MIFLPFSATPAKGLFESVAGTIESIPISKTNNFISIFAMAACQMRFACCKIVLRQTNVLIFIVVLIYLFIYLFIFLSIYL